MFGSPVSVHIPLHRFAAVLIHAAVVADSAKEPDAGNDAAEASRMDVDAPSAAAALLSDPDMVRRWKLNR